MGEGSEGEAFRSPEEMFSIIIILCWTPYPVCVIIPVLRDFDAQLDVKFMLME